MDKEKDDDEHFISLENKDIKKDDINENDDDDDDDDNDDVGELKK